MGTLSSCLIRSGISNYKYIEKAKEMWSRMVDDLKLLKPLDIDKGGGNGYIEDIECGDSLSSICFILYGLV